MTEYLTKLKEEMEARLGCGIEVVEDRDLRCPCKIEFAMATTASAIATGVRRGQTTSGVSEVRFRKAIVTNLI